MFSTYYVLLIAVGISAVTGIAAYLAWRSKQTAVAAQGEMRRLTEQRQLALTAAKMGWWHFDPISNISTWDSRYAELFEVEGSEANNDDILKLLHPDDLPAVLEAVGKALDPVRPTPYAMTYRLQATSNGGEERWIEAHGMAEFTGEGEQRHAVSFAGTVRDITDHKLAQEAQLLESQRYAEELERRVAERTRQLETANRELEAFSYSVSHDLRAPLRAVDGYTRILMEDYGSQLDAEGRRICSVISDSASRLGVLIDDLLAFSRLARIPMQSSLIDMEESVRNVFMELTSEEERPRIDFRIVPLPQAYGDRAMMQQVWVNLLSNAIKFSSKSGQPRISVSATHNNEEIEYCVRDNGAGFDMKYANKLFGVFQRLHSLNEFPGTGVGLAIVQRIIARHGGSVRGSGEPGNGAEFIFTLPMGEKS
jgi:PAS domain S-box-containing protein